MKCGIYVRVSTGKQDTGNQLNQLRDFARKQGWTVVAEYADEISGKHSDREQFQRMFRDASKRKFDVLLFWSLDRLSREGALETLQHLNRLTSYGIQWRSLTEQYLDSTGIFREAVIGILAVVAKQERVRLSERTKAGLERARKEGIEGLEEAYSEPGQVASFADAPVVYAGTPFAHASSTYNPFGS